MMSNGIMAEDRLNKEMQRYDKAPNDEDVVGEDGGNKENGKPISSFPRDERGCINPCPRFEPILDPSSSDKNCNRSLDNPCRMCTHSLHDECPRPLRETLLKPEVLEYMEFKKSKERKQLFKGDFAGMYARFHNELANVEEEIDELKRKVDNSALPNFIAKKFNKKDYNILMDKKTRLQSKIDTIDNIKDMRHNDK